MKKDKLIDKLRAARETHGLDACVHHKGYQYTVPVWVSHVGAYHWLRTHATKPATVHFEPKEK